LVVDIESEINATVTTTVCALIVVCPYNIHLNA
jgi:hypothetical protein